MATATKVAAATKPVRVVQLVRVSSKQQMVAGSPETQRHALAGLLSRRFQTGGYTVVAIDPDAESRAAGGKGAHVSGRKARAERPDLQRLAAMEAAGFDELHIGHIDRQSRHGDLDERFYVFQLCKRVGALIVEANDTVTNPRNPNDEIIWFFRTRQAADEATKISERATNAAARLKSQGRNTGTTALGITYDKTTGKWGTDADITKVQEIFRRYADGASLGSMAVIVGWRDGTGLAKLLRNPIFRGLTREGVRVFAEAEQPITDDLWLRVQARLGKVRTEMLRQRDTAKAPIWASGLIASAYESDGYDMSKPIRHKLVGSRAAGRHDRYRCTCAGTMSGLSKCGFGFPRAAQVHGWIDAVMVRLTTDPSIVAMVKATTEQTDTTSDRDTLTAQIAKLDASIRKSNHNNEMGFKTDAEHLKDATGYMNLRKVAQERLDALAVVTPADPAVLSAWLDGFSWNVGATEQIKRDLLTRYVKVLTVNKEGVQTVVLRVPGSDGMPVRLGLENVKEAA